MTIDFILNLLPDKNVGRVTFANDEQRLGAMLMLKAVKRWIDVEMKKEAKVSPHFQFTI